MPCVGAWQVVERGGRGAAAAEAGRGLGNVGGVFNAIMDVDAANANANRQAIAALAAPAVVAAEANRAQNERRRADRDRRAEEPAARGNDDDLIPMAWDQ